jgi:hypothetical protein
MTSERASLWLELCRHPKEAYHRVFWANLEKFTMHFDGSLSASPMVEEIAREECALEALGDCRGRMTTFVAAHTCTGRALIK